MTILLDCLRACGYQVRCAIMCKNNKKGAKLHCSFWRQKKPHLWLMLTGRTFTSIQSSLKYMLCNHPITIGKNVCRKRRPVSSSVVFVSVKIFPSLSAMSAVKKIKLIAWWYIECNTTIIWYNIVNTGHLHNYRKDGDEAESRKDVHIGSDCQLCVGFKDPFLIWFKNKTLYL